MYNVQFTIYSKRNISRCFYSIRISYVNIKENIFEIIITILNGVLRESFSCLTR